MKIKTILSHIVPFILVCVLGFASNLAAQDTVTPDRSEESNRPSHHRLFVDVNAAFNISSNSSSLGDGWTSMSKLDIIPTIRVGYMLNQNLGFGAGLKFAKHTSGFDIQGFSAQLENEFIDKDNDLYHPIFENVNLNEINTYSSLDIPIFINYQMAFGNGKITAFSNVGVLLSLVSQMNYTLDGSLTRKGDYPKYNVILEGYPEYNFGELTFNPSSTTQLQKPNMGISAFLTLGVLYEVAKNIHVRLGGTYTMGFSDMRPTTGNLFNGFHSSLFLEKTSLNSLGGEIGIVYFFL